MGASVWHGFFTPRKLAFNFLFWGFHWAIFAIGCNKAISVLPRLMLSSSPCGYREVLVWSSPSTPWSLSCQCAETSCESFVPRSDGYRWTSPCGSTDRSPTLCCSSPSSTSPPIMSTSSTSRGHRSVPRSLSTSTTPRPVASQDTSCCFACCSCTPRPTTGSDSSLSRLSGTLTTSSSHSSSVCTRTLPAASCVILRLPSLPLIRRTSGPTALVTKVGDGSS
ncbi:hypothetical protein DM02DRAFT_181484 [Periconia macrospinosa]|uniref:Uncharacterized protein n=1 Tax=Periconia macrospinosa TaxID=97972 RepID=A0A2V1D9H4_9PLEO|nr:hypothetical protein DM02DRAFT_181484 [Periconia macrospinosa]